MRTFKFIFYFLFFIHLFLFLIGAYYIGVTFFIYFFICSLLFKIIELKNINIKYKVFVLFSCISLFTTELILKYGFKKYLSYSELNGRVFYGSPFAKGDVDKFETEHINNFFNERAFEKNDFGVSTENIQYLTKYNEYGCRGDNISNKKNVKVLFLGDSFTEGVGTPDDSTWSNLLFKKLFKDSSQYINAGVSGAGIAFEISTAKHFLQRISPELIILCINSTDLISFLKDNNLVKKPFWEFFYATSYIFRSIAHDFFNMSYMLISNNELEKLKLVARNQIVEMLIFEISEIEKTSNARILVFANPFKGELSFEESEFDYISKKLYGSNIDFKDLHYDIRAMKDSLQFGFKEIYWENDGHFNSKGYSILADKMYEYINN